MFKSRIMTFKDSAISNFLFALFAFLNAVEPIVSPIISLNGNCRKEFIAFDNDGIEFEMSFGKHLSYSLDMSWW